MAEFLSVHRKFIYWLIFSIGLFSFIVIQYFGLIHFHYPVPPGHDAMIHYQMAQPFYNHTINLIEYIKNGSYPPLFLIFISSTAHLFRTDMMSVMLWSTPAILIFAALAIFFLTKELFGRWAGLFAFLLYSFAARTPIQQLNDGGYPNLISAQILLPLAFLFLLLALRKTKLFSKIVFAILFVFITFLIPLTHHITTFYFALIVGVILILGLFKLFADKKISWKNKVFQSILVIFMALLGGYLISKSPLFAAAHKLYQSAVGNPDPEAFIPLTRYPSTIGTAFSILGFLGFFYLPFAYRKNPAVIFNLTIILLFTLVLLIGSRVSTISNPDRLVRDLALPLSILGGTFSARILIDINKKRKNIFLPALALFVIFFLIGSRTRILNSFRYEPMVRVTSADMQAISQLKWMDPSKLLVEDYNFYLPIFLPNWDITNIYVPETKQPPEAKPLDPNLKQDQAVLMSYDYIYIVDSQLGWTPAGVKFHFADSYITDHKLKEIGKFESQTNTVYLFKVVK